MNSTLADRRRKRMRTIQALRRTMPPPCGTAEIQGVPIAVRCASAERDLQIGGDWYLSMPLPGGELLLAIGDALGHGLAAASSMLRLRFAMTALAAEGYPPAEILGRLNDELCRTGPVAGASAIVAVYRPLTGELVSARAGHPPALVSDGEHTTTLGDAGGPLLGVVPGYGYRTTVRRVGPADQLILYTDGLLRRGQTVDEWAAGTAVAVRQAGGDATALVHSVDYHACGDDACLLIARLRP